MTFSLARTTSLRAALAATLSRAAAATAAAFQRAESARHHRLGSCNLNAEALHDLRLASEQAFGPACR